MAEDTQQAIKTPVKDTQEVAVPTTEQKTSEPVVEQVVTESGLPDSASDRTKHEFDKLREDLRGERQRREAVESAFKSMQPAKTETITPLVDPETGYLNEEGLTDLQKRTIAAEKRAAEAEQSIKGYMQDQENKALYAAHPDLNPNSETFNQKVHNLTSSLLLDSMLHPDQYGGKQLDPVEAASLAKGYGSIETAKKEGAKEAIEQLTPKEQASLEAVGTPARRGEMASDRLNDLRLRSRKGDADAIAERLTRLKNQG